MVHRKKDYFLMTYGVRRNDKKKICSFYLFLVCVKDVYVLPIQAIEHKSNPNKIGGKPFNETVNRLSTFFEKENYTNVRGLAIFGY